MLSFHVKFVQTDRQTDGRTDGQMDNGKKYAPIFGYWGIKKKFTGYKRLTAAEFQIKGSNIIS